MAGFVYFKQDPDFYVLKEDTSPCIFGSIEKQRWSYACAKQLIERLIYGMCSCLIYIINLPFLFAFSDFFCFIVCCPYSIAEGAENDLDFTIVRPFNWIGPRMDFIPGIDGPSEGVPRVLACFSNVCIISFVISHHNTSKIHNFI